MKRMGTIRGVVILSHNSLSLVLIAYLWFQLEQLWVYICWYNHNVEPASKAYQFGSDIHYSEQKPTPQSHR